MAGHCRRVAGNGGWSTAQVDVGASRVCDRLLSRRLLFPGFSFIHIADAASSSRAEVVDRDDTVKQRFVHTADFGPVFCAPSNHTKFIVALPQPDYDVSIIIPANSEPV